MTILADQEAETRRKLLAHLRSALATLGVTSILARNHRLILRYNMSPGQPSGLIDPVLHVFANTGRKAVTTDGTVFRLDGEAEFPVTDVNAVARLISEIKLPIKTVKGSSDR